MKDVVTLAVLSDSDFISRKLGEQVVGRGVFMGTSKLDEELNILFDVRRPLVVHWQCAFK